MITLKQEQDSLFAEQDSPQSQASEDFLTALSIIEHEFPLEFLIAGELAQFETYAIPSISKLLHQTGQYEKDGLKRLDDTRATLYTIFTNPAHSSERETMITHLNWIHSHYQISNDDNLYTLLRMFFNPIEWIQRWGWRKLTQNEIAALTKEMIQIGKAMNIEFESESFEDLHAWQVNYRLRHQQYSQDNEHVARGTIDGIRDHFPSWLRIFCSPLVRSYLHDKDLLRALGLKPANMIQNILASIPLIVWQQVTKFYRPWRHHRFSKGWLANYFPSYENNTLDCCQLGPRKLIQHRRKKGGCPFH